MVLKNDTMKKLLTVVAATLLTASCKGDKETVTTTDQATETDTVGTDVVKRTVTAVSTTTETDTAEITITTGKVEIDTLKTD